MIITEAGKYQWIYRLGMIFDILAVLLVITLVSYKQWPVVRYVRKI